MTRPSRFPLLLDLYRVLVTGIHDRHSQSKDKSSMLRVLAKLYSRSSKTHTRVGLVDGTQLTTLLAVAALYRPVVPGPEAEEEDEGEQLCRFCSRDAALFAACLSSTVFLSAADTSPPPMRALVGQHFADSHWLDLLMDCLRDENCDLSSHRGEEEEGGGRAGVQLLTWLRQDAADR